MKACDRLVTRPVIAILAVMMAALLSAPTYAQEGKEPLTRRSDAQKKEDAAIDKAYRAATKGEIEPAVRHDPWGKVRPAEDDKKAKR